MKIEIFREETSQHVSQPSYPLPAFYPLIKMSLTTPKAPEDLAADNRGRQNLSNEALEGVANETLSVAGAG